MFGLQVNIGARNVMQSSRGSKRSVVKTWLEELVGLPDIGNGDGRMMGQNGGCGGDTGCLANLRCRCGSSLILY